MTNETKRTGKNESTDREESKSISVKGVNSDLYRKVIEKAIETGKTIGEITNDAYKTLLSTMEFALQKSSNVLKRDFEVVSNFSELTISDADLKELGKPVAFSNVDKLDLSAVSNENFDKYIKSLLHIKKLIISSELRKSLILTRAKYIDKIEQTE